MSAGVISITVVVATYLVAREAVQGWSALCILFALTSALITAANIAGFEQTMSYVNGSNWRFHPSAFDQATVLLSASLMLIVRKFRSEFRSSR